MTTIYDYQVRLKDFYAYMPKHLYIFTPTGEMWPAVSIDSRLPRVPVLTKKNGPRSATRTGKPKFLKASKWLDKNRAVEQMTWAPGEPHADQGPPDRRRRLDRAPGAATFNLYRPPMIDPATPASAAVARPRRRSLSRRRRPHHPVAGASGAAAGREDQPRARARRPAGHRQGHHPRAGQARGRAVEFRRSLAATVLGRVQRLRSSR